MTLLSYNDATKQLGFILWVVTVFMDKLINSSNISGEVTILAGRPENSAVLTPQMFKMFTFVETV